MALNKQYSKDQMRAAQQRFLQRQSQSSKNTHKTPKMLSEEYLKAINSNSNSLTQVISILNSPSTKHKSIILNLWKLSKIIENSKVKSDLIQEISRARSVSLSSIKNSDCDDEDESYDHFQSPKIFKSQCVEIMEIIRKFCLSRRAGLRISALRCLSLILCDKLLCSEAYVQRLDQTLLKCMDYVARKQEETSLIFKCIKKWMHVMKEDVPFCLILGLVANTEKQPNKNNSSFYRNTGSQNLQKISMSLLCEYIILAPEQSAKRGIFEHVAIKIFLPNQNSSDVTITDFDNLELESVSFALSTVEKPPFNIVATAISVIIQPVETCCNFYHNRQLQIAETIFLSFMSTWNGINLMCSGGCLSLFSAISNSNFEIRKRAIMLLYKIFQFRQPKKYEEFNAKEFDSHGKYLKGLKKLRWKQKWSVQEDFIISEADDCIKSESSDFTARLDVMETRIGLLIQMCCNYDLQKQLISAIEQAEKTIQSKHLDEHLKNPRVDWQEQEESILLIANLMGELTFYAQKYDVSAWSHESNVQYARTVFKNNNGVTSPRMGFALSLMSDSRRRQMFNMDISLFLSRFLDLNLVTVEENKKQEFLNKIESNDMDLIDEDSIEMSFETSSESLNESQISSNDYKIEVTQPDQVKKLIEQDSVLKSSKSKKNFKRRLSLPVIHGTLLSSSKFKNKNLQPLVSDVIFNTTFEEEFKASQEGVLNNLTSSNHYSRWNWLQISHHLFNSITTLDSLIDDSGIEKLVLFFTPPHGNFSSIPYFQEISHIFDYNEMNNRDVDQSRGSVEDIFDDFSGFYFSTKHCISSFSNLIKYLIKVSESNSFSSSSLQASKSSLLDDDIRSRNSSINSNFNSNNNSTVPDFQNPKNTAINLISSPLTNSLTSNFTSSYLSDTSQQKLPQFYKLTSQSASDHIQKIFSSVLQYFTLMINQISILQLTKSHSIFYPVILADLVTNRQFDTHPISAFFAELLQKTESNPTELIISKIFLASLCFKNQEKSRNWLEMALFNNANQELEEFSIGLLKILIKKSSSPPHNSAESYRKLDSDTLNWIVKNISLVYYTTHKSNKMKIRDLFQDICDNSTALKIIAQLKPNIQLTSLSTTQNNNNNQTLLAQNLVVRLVADVSALKYLQNSGGNIFKQHFEFWWSHGLLEHSHEAGKIWAQNMRTFGKCIVKDDYGDYRFSGKFDTRLDDGNNAPVYLPPHLYRNLAKN